MIACCVDQHRSSSPNTKIAIPTQNQHDTDKSDTTDTKSDTRIRNQHREQLNDSEKKGTRPPKSGRHDKDSRGSLCTKAGIGGKESIGLATHRAQYK